MGVGNQSKWRWAAIHKLTQQHSLNHKEKRDDGYLINGVTERFEQIKGKSSQEI